MLINLWFRQNVYFIHEPKELLELKDCKSKLQNSVQLQRTDGTHMFTPFSYYTPKLPLSEYSEQREHRRDFERKVI